jgi:Family of unknown function (DUF6090)
MILYRMIKREFFMNREFNRYMWYAAGEILLVVIGIFIALQIDTLYQNKDTQKRLMNYLSDISEGISDDLARLEQLKSTRTDISFNAASTFLATSRSNLDGVPDFYNEAFTQAAALSLEQAQKKLSLASNTGSYRALESSGLLSDLSDSHLEALLHEYYRSAERISYLEQELNNVVRELTLRFQTEAASEIPQILVREPLIMWGESNSGDATRTMQQKYWKLLNHSITHSLLRIHMSQPIFEEYEHLLSLGRKIVYRIAALRQMPGKETLPNLPVFSAAATTGHPILHENGRPNYHSYGIFTAPINNFDWDIVYDRVWIRDDALHINFPGDMPWAYLYWKVGPIDIVFQRYSKDYSMYDRIRIEIKRDEKTECANIQLEIKDIDNAEKGELASIGLDLTPQWQTFTFDLAEFVEADLTRLNVVAGLLYSDNAVCNVSVRDIRYLTPEQH